MRPLDFLIESARSNILWCDQNSNQHTPLPGFHVIRHHAFKTINYLHLWLSLNCCKGRSFKYVRTGAVILCRAFVCVRCVTRAYVLIASPLTWNNKNNNGKPRVTHGDYVIWLIEIKLMQEQLAADTTRPFPSCYRVKSATFFTHLCVQKSSLTQIYVIQQFEKSSLCHTQLDNLLF